MKKSVLVILFSFVFGSFAIAHDGHDKTPGSIQAPHGGVVQGTSQLYIELVNDSSGIKLYPLTHDLKVIPTGEVKLVATSQVPKKKKENLALVAVGDHFEAKVDAKGAYRYTLSLDVGYKTKKEKVVFQVEPQN
jgi:hypothetical protein